MLLFHFFLTIFLLFLPFFRTIDTNEAWLIKPEILLIVGGISLIYLIKQKKIFHSYLNIFKWLYIFLLFSLIRGMFSKNPLFSAFGTLNIAIFPIWLIIIENLFKKNLYKKLLKIQFYLLSIYFFICYFNIFDIIIHWWEYGELSFKVGINFNNYFPFYNPNFTSIYFFILSFFIYFYFNSYLELLISLIIALLMGTRNIFFSLFLYIIYRYIFKSKPRYGVFIISFLFLFIILFTTHTNRLTSFSSIEHRLLMWKTTLEMIKKHPVFGVGIGNYLVYFPIYYKDFFKINKTYSITLYAHNDILEFIAENGIISIFIILFFIEYIKKTPNKAQVLFFIFLIISLVSLPFKMPAIFIILISSILLNEHNKPITIKLCPIKRGFVFVLGVFSVYIGGIFFISNLYFTRALKLKNIKMDYNSAIHYLKRAIAIRKNYTPAYVYLGDTYNKMGNIKMAIFWTKKALKFEPYRPIIHYNLGNLFGKTGNFKKAIKKLRFFIELEPYGKRADDARLSLAIIYLKCKDIKNAEPLLRELRHRYKDNWLYKKQISILKSLKKQTSQ